MVKYSHRSLAESPKNHQLVECSFFALFFFFLFKTWMTTDITGPAISIPIKNRNISICYTREYC